jgi:Fe-S-cluster containining protein
MPIFYECQRCTACCRWPGQVRVTDAEISSIAAFLRRSEFDFIQRFTRLAQGRRGLSLQDKPNGECIFLNGRDCAIQPVNPQQCRAFPNLWNFPGFQRICQAVPESVSETEYAWRLTTIAGHPATAANG